MYLLSIMAICFGRKSEPVCTESHREGRQGHSLCPLSLDSVPLHTGSAGLMETLAHPSPRGPTSSQE